ncbi:prenyltransferase [Fluviibacter phosphoraccumulans]|uniref:1,4-dihydroxy-2-naphthoate octaprenyltransferase n=1 Tax=Fluviibacter phosphoraccumulans TaxID=1751046 RepID=A0A7R6TNN4_9RHOO|nr:prenyltransferase [Fluviibacter phosphoraccumulans]BBU69757.1 1,4-dihydroxy-2-naphthoate octaprenyltransferase [Fluviibacter phosphoraccumulans]BBU71060.1 1,4-dihydroxy-2-naphthoate octaprenyltransferase [Fluviibacter phosphoraccumulans]
MKQAASIWLAATRPAFLSVTLVGVLLGLSAAMAAQAYRSTWLAALTILFALIAHAGANVINDYYDARNGSDAANVDRIYPFTGGSRFIQDGVLTSRQTARFGYLLLGIVIPSGLYLVWESGPGLICIGLIGLFAGWAYSSKPFALQSRGVGELTIILAWLMVVLGSDYVQQKSVSESAVLTGLAYALLVANVLFVNQIPDRIADRAAGKKTVIVRWGTQVAPWGSLALYSGAIMIVAIGIFNDQLPGTTALAFLAAIPALFGLSKLFKKPTDRAQLMIVIPTTIISCLLFGLLLALGMLL